MMIVPIVLRFQGVVIARALRIASRLLGGFQLLLQAIPLHLVRVLAALAVLLAGQLVNVALADEHGRVALGATRQFELVIENGAWSFQLYARINLGHLQAAQYAGCGQICTVGQLELLARLLARLWMTRHFQLPALGAGTVRHCQGIGTGTHAIVQGSVDNVDLLLVGLVRPKEGRLVVVKDSRRLVRGMHPGCLLVEYDHGVQDGIADRSVWLAVKEGLEGTLDDRIREHRLHALHFALDAQRLQHVIPMQMRARWRAPRAAGSQLLVIDEGALYNRFGIAGLGRINATDEHYLREALRNVLHIVVEYLIRIQFPFAVAAAHLLRILICGRQRLLICHICRSLADF